MDGSVVQVNTPTGASTTERDLIAYPEGGGQLHLSAKTVPTATWFFVSVGAAGDCPPWIRPGTDCVRVHFTFLTQRLARGTYSASVTISDPEAIDAPQVVMVVARVGAPGVAQVSQFLNPGQSTQVQIDWGGYNYSNAWRAVADDGGNWMRLVVPSQGSFFSFSPVSVRLAPSVDMAPGTYVGRVEVNTTLDARTVPVSMTVTDGPIATPSADSIHVRVAEDGPLALSNPEIPPLRLNNTGRGDLAVTGASASGAGIFAHVRKNAVIVRVSRRNLGPGSYTGAIRIECNAVNCPVEVPVQFDVVAAAPPQVRYQGMLTSYPFGLALVTTPGGIVTIDGEQFTTARFESNIGYPLPDTLGDAQVLVNGQPARLFNLSSTQATVQVPASTALGLGEVQVVRAGTTGNRVTIHVVPQLPRIVSVLNEGGGPIDMAHPIKAGEVVVFEVTGLGSTTPEVPDGMPAPGNLVAVPNVAPVLLFSGYQKEIAIVPNSYMIPGRIGVFRVIVRMPSGFPASDRWVNVRIKAGETLSNPVQIRLE